MLTQWTVENFKSFHQKQTLPLSSINVFAGANSSGKSSFIQSLLLLKQTLQYGSIEKTLVLNGPILKLGTFDDVRNDAADQDEPMSFGWEFSTKQSDWPSNIPMMQPAWLRDAFRLRRGAEITSVSGQLSWTLDSNDSSKFAEAEYASGLDQLYPALQNGILGGTYGDDSKPFYWKYARDENQSGGEVQTHSGMLEGDYFSTQLDGSTEAAVLEDAFDGYISGTYIRHFLPVLIRVNFDARAREARYVATSIVGTRSTLLSGFGNVDDFVVPATVVGAIVDWVCKSFESQFEFTREDAKVSEIRDAIQPWFTDKNALSTFVNPDKLTDKQSELRAFIVSELERTLPQKRDTELESAPVLRSSERLIRSFFTTGVRYLGPLRDEPRPVYPVEALEAPTDVGYRGQHTAAVLDLNRNRIISYVPPIEVVHGTYAVGRGSLQDAVNAWSSYMGVAASVQTTERSVFGHQLQVETEGGKESFRDLTNVGVGVSQVLPILVMSLLAPFGSLLILEQPELHLHPKVQARLADFFIGLAFARKQCILETHSEYLIDRLRRRIAEADSDKVSELVRIYFVEREGHESDCREVNVSEFGALMSWPKDFFDQSEEESAAILQAAVAKQKLKS